MKKKIFIVMVVMALVLGCTGCGSKRSSDTATYGENSPTGYVTEAYESETEKGFSEDYASDSAAMADVGGGFNESAEEAVSGEENANTATTGNTTKKLTKEMLVYRGALSIDTLDFNTSVNSFKAMLAEKDGFVERESYTDNYSTNSYYATPESSKHNLYTATVRIPSSEYDAIMNAASDFGDVRLKNSNVSNVTQEYGTYQSQLEIYEAEYKRYLSLLEKATDDEYALKIENELFNIQIQIANLKSGITNLENDVAYSYIDITIKEVTKYEEKPEKTDTFLDRFKNVCKDSWERFLAFLEEITFFLILNIYYIVILLVIVLIVWRVLRKRKTQKKQKVQNTQMVQGQQEAQEAQKVQEEQKTQEK